MCWQSAVLQVTVFRLMCLMSCRIRWATHTVPSQRLLCGILVAGTVAWLQWHRASRDVRDWLELIKPKRASASVSA